MGMATGGGSEDALWDSCAALRAYVDLGQVWRSVTWSFGVELLVDSC